jgi:hypothetical protein
MKHEPMPDAHRTGEPHGVDWFGAALCGSSGRTVTSDRRNGASLCLGCWDVMAGPTSQPALRELYAKRARVG